MLGHWERTVRKWTSVEAQEMHFDSVQTLQKRMQVFPDDFTSFARIFAPSICPSLAAFLISAFTLSPSRSTFKTCPGRHHRSKQIHGMSYMDAHVFIMTRMIPGEALLVCKSMGADFQQQPNLLVQPAHLLFHCQSPLFDLHNKNISEFECEVKRLSN
jgi:hypothetical protein